MNTKSCSKCNITKPISDFHAVKTENRHMSWCKACIYDAQKTRWIERKIKAINCMGGKCQSCGYNKNYTALEFHHLDPSQKELDWKTLRLQSWEKIIKELSKCALLCSNCHRETHYPNAMINQDFKINTRLCPSLKSPTGTCPNCGTETYDTKFCSTTCAAAAKRKVVRPTREELEKLIATTPFTQIGKMFNVSDNAIRKWAKCYGITL